MHLSKPLLKLKPCLHRSLSILAIFGSLLIFSCKEENKPKETPNLSENDQKTLNNSEISGKYSVKTLNNNNENLGNLIFDFNSEEKRNKPSSRLAIVYFLKGWPGHCYLFIRLAGKAACLSSGRQDVHLRSGVC